MGWVFTTGKINLNLFLPRLTAGSEWLHQGDPSETSTEGPKLNPKSRPVEQLVLFNPCHCGQLLTGTPMFFSPTFSKPHVVLLECPGGALQHRRDRKHKLRVPILQSARETACASAPFDTFWGYSLPMYVQDVAGAPRRRW